MFHVKRDADFRTLGAGLGPQNPLRRRSRARLASTSPFQQLIELAADLLGACAGPPEPSPGPWGVKSLRRRGG